MVDQSLLISHERIYQVWTDKCQGGSLYMHLGQNNKKRKKQNNTDLRINADRNRTRIDERPNIVEHKTRIGDWEIDTVIGQHHQGALVTIVDRVPKVHTDKKVSSKQADRGTASNTFIISALSGIKVFTITADNGKEFIDHESITQQLGATVYFAHPYHSWERGLNENTNGLIRQYFTKRSSYEHITDQQVLEDMDKLNQRPRKT